MVGVFFVKFMDYCFIICHASVEPKSAVVSLCQGLSVHFACTSHTYCVFIHNKDAAWYLQAYCLARQALRVFKLCRMLDVTLLDAVFTPGPQHTPQPMDPVEAPGPLLHLELMFTPAAAYRVYDMFPPEWVTQLPDGRFFVSAFYPESPWIYGFLLSFGADVAVLSPPQVQQALREAGQKVAALYGAPE